MWAGAVTMYGIGIKQKEVVSFIKFLLKNSGKNESKGFLDYIKSEYGAKDLDDLQKKKSTDEYLFSWDALLREVEYNFSKTLGSLELEIGMYPHDIIERYGGDIVGVIGQNICTLEISDEAPKLKKIDSKKILKTLSDIFTAKRCTPSAKNKGNDFPTVKTHIGYYTFPLGCVCCT